MRKRKIKQSNTGRSRIYIIPFYIAGVLFILTGVVYAGGKILQLVTPEQTVFASPYLQQNQFIDVEKKLVKKGLTVVSKDLSSNKTVLTVELEKGPTVIFSSSYDIDWQISSLHSIIYKLTIDNKQPKQIDFRFEKPVVKF